MKGWNYGMFIFTKLCLYMCGYFYPSECKWEKLFAVHSILDVGCFIDKTHLDSIQDAPNPVLKCTCSAQDKKVYLQKVPNTTLYYYLKYNLLNIQWFLVGTKRLHIKGLVHYVYSSTFCSNVCSNTHILIQSWNGDYLSYVLVPLNNDPMFCFSHLKQGTLQ